MSVVRDDCDDRQARVDRMIDEFRKAQSRRIAKVTTVKGNDQQVELQMRCPRPRSGRRVRSYTDFITELE